jgi:hypothetical protein
MFSRAWARRHAAERLGVEGTRSAAAITSRSGRPRELAERLDAYAASIS